MLYCSKSRLVPTNINLMTLESKDEMYYYVHRSLYDQAVILSDRYKDKEKELMDMIGTYKSDDVPECVSYFHLVVPEPLNILGYFLALVDQFDLLSADIEVLCGTIHQMSSAINFRKLISMPKEIRAQVQFSLNIQEEYQLSWDRFFQESLQYNPDMWLGAQQVQQIYVNNVADEEPDEGEDEDGIFDWNAFDQELDNSEKKEEKSGQLPKPSIVAEEVEETIDDEEDDGARALAELL